MSLLDFGGGGGLTDPGTWLSVYRNLQNPDNFTRDYHNYIAQTANQARRAGISPLAALGANPQPTGQVSSTPGPLGSLIGSKDPNQDLNRDYLQAQIDRTHAETDAIKKQSDLALADHQETAKKAISKPLEVEHIPFTQTPGWSDADEVGKHYGWMVDGPYGVIKGARDLIHNFVEKSRSAVEAAGVHKNSNAPDTSDLPSWYQDLF